MKKMTLGNRILAMLLAFVMILTGIAREAHSMPRS